MSYTDPSGFFFKKLLGGLFGTKVLGALAKVPLLNAAVQIGVGIGCGAAAAACLAAYNGLQTYAVTGSLGASLRSAAISYATAYAFSEIGSHFDGLKKTGSINFGGNMLTGGQVAEQISAHALVGGITAELQGGKFGHGFFSAGVTKGLGGAFLPGGDNLSTGEIVKGTVVSAIIGGTASKISGGKFANGAQTGAFQFLFNQAAKPARPDLGAAGNTIRNRLTSDYEKELFERYWLGQGNKVLTQSELDSAVNALSTSIVSQSQVTINGTQYTKTLVSFYANADFDQAYGSATIYYDSNGQAAGFFDNYNFDSKPWGVRPYRFEVQTRAVGTAGTTFGNAQSYEICNGVGC